MPQSILRWRLSGLSILGVLIALVGGIWLVRTASFVTRAAEATGVVTWIDQDNSNMSEWHVAISFTDSQGIFYTSQVRFISPFTFPVLKPGDEVRVLYDKGKPSYAKVNSFATLWFEPLFVIGFGSFFSVVSNLMLLAMRFVARHQQQQMDI